MTVTRKMNGEPLTCEVDGSHPYITDPLSTSLRLEVACEYLFCCRCVHSSSVECPHSVCVLLRLERFTPATRPTGNHRWFQFLVHHVCAASVYHDSCPVLTADTTIVCCDSSVIFSMKVCWHDSTFDSLPVFCEFLSMFQHFSLFKYDIICLVCEWNFSITISYYLVAISIGLL